MRHVCKLLASSVTVLFLCLNASPSPAQNESFEAAEQVPAGIHHASAGGFWNQGKDEGFYRAVVVARGVEHVSHQLFIQWLRTNSKTQDYELIRTVNVKELNLGHGFVLAVTTSFGDINAFRVDVTANSRGGKAKRFVITVKGDGKYVIQAP